MSKARYKLLYKPRETLHKKFDQKTWNCTKDRRFFFFELSALARGLRATFITWGRARRNWKQLNPISRNCELQFRPDPL